MASVSSSRENYLQRIGTSTGLYDFDHMLGGFQPGNLYVIAGRPGMGKTNFVLGATVHATVMESRAVAIYSTTTDSNSLIMRMMAQLASVPLQAIYRGACDTTQQTALQKGCRGLIDYQIARIRLNYFRCAGGDSFRKRCVHQEQ